MDTLILGESKFKFVRVNQTRNLLISLFFLLHKKSYKFDVEKYNFSLIILSVCNNICEAPRQKAFLFI